MSDGSPNRRTFMVLTWIVMSTALSASGCAQIPVPRSNSNQVHLPPPPVNASVATAAHESSPTERDESLPPLPADLASSSELPEDAPTPLLDEALAKADAELAIEIDERSNESESDVIRSEEGREPLPVVLTQVHQIEAAPAPAAAADPRLVALRTATPASTALSAAPVTIDPEKPVKPIDPDELWVEGITRLQKLAGEQARASRPGAWTQRARLLDVIVGGDPKSDAGKSDPTRPYRLALAALGIPQDTVTLDAPLRGAEIRAAVLALESETPLEISELRLCRKVNGFGNFEPLDTATCKPGQSLIIYCEMSGLQYSPAGELFHSRLSSRVELVPTNGGEPVWAQSLGSAEDVCRRRRRDYYVNYRIVLGETIPPGVYELRIVQTDEIAGHLTSASIPLTIQH